MSKMIEDIDYRKAFFGNQKGVLLSNRAPNDPHVVFTIITEDDGQWFMGGDSVTSGYWLKDLQQVLKEAEVWLDNFATKDQWGWIFK